MPPGGLGLSMSGGTLQNIPGAASREEQINALNDVINRLNQLTKTQVFSDATSKRMLIGYQKDGWGTGSDFGIKMSRPGIDVTKATDAELLIKMDLTGWTYNDSSGNKVMKQGTLEDSKVGIDWFDPTDGRNFMRAGVMPDNTGQVAVAKPGKTVKDIFAP